MNDKKDKRAIGALIIGACVGLVLWVILLALRVSGLTDMHWALVLTGFVWLTWLVYALMGLAALCVYAVMRAWSGRLVRSGLRELRANGGLISLDKYAEVYGTRRRRGETDEQLRARIIKIISNIHERPEPPRMMFDELISSMKLDELAWEDYYTTRMPGESDEELRRRLHAMVDNKHADMPELSGDELDMRAFAHFRIFRKPGETDEELLARMVNKPR